VVRQRAGGAGESGSELNSDPDFWRRRSSTDEELREVAINGNCSFNSSAHTVGRVTTGGAGPATIEVRIRTVRGQSVLLDSDLAAL
jgi:hypothetical protein